MVHVLLRIAVWVVVLGVGYLVFGPELFDSSRGENPFETDAAIFLPPAKSQRHLEYDRISGERKLNADELNEYQGLIKERQSSFWQRQGVSVEEALSGVKTQRKERLADILAERGLSQQEATVFLVVVERDHPSLLADQD